MRGRTNIPPRVGGIVTGVVREYEVAEESGISIGDYVQIVTNNSPSKSAELKSTFSQPSVSGLYELSDSRRAFFYYTSSGIVAKTFITDASGFTDIVQHEVIGQPTLSSITSMEYVQMSEDVFVLIAGASGTYTVLRIDYSSGSFRCTQLDSLTGTARTDEKAYFDKHLCLKWDETTFMFLLSNQVFVFSLSTSTVSKLSNISVGSSAREIHKMGNRVIVVHTYSNNLEEVLVSVYDVYSGNLSLAYSVEFPGAVTLSTVIPIDDTHCIVRYNSYDNSGYVLTLGENDYVYSEEQVLSELSTAALIRWSRVGEYILLTNKSSSTVFGVLIKYDDSLNSIVYGNYFTITNDSSSGSYVYLIGDSFQLPDSNKVVLQYQKGYEGSSNYGVPSVSAIMMKMEQGMLLQDEDYTKVKRYSTIINGIAKTSGSAGEVIEVYSPD